MKKILNGVEVELTQAEVDEFNARQAAWEAGEADRRQLEFSTVLQTIIDGTAVAKRYASAVSCISYMDSSNSDWSTEAHTFNVWRDAVWEYAYDYLERAQNGEIANPTVEDFKAGIPAIVWPQE